VAAGRECLNRLKFQAWSDSHSASRSAMHEEFLTAF
jgi:hypothetical protein